MLVPTVSRVLSWVLSCIKKLPPARSWFPVQQLREQLAERQGPSRAMLAMPREELIACHGNSFVLATACTARGHSDHSEGRTRALLLVSSNGPMHRFGICRSQGLLLVPAADPSGPTEPW